MTVMYTQKIIMLLLDPVLCSQTIHLIANIFKDKMQCCCYSVKKKKKKLSMVSHNRYALNSQKPFTVYRNERDRYHENEFCFVIDGLLVSAEIL